MCQGGGHSGIMFYDLQINFYQKLTLHQPLDAQKKYDETRQLGSIFTTEIKLQTSIYCTMTFVRLMKNKKAGRGAKGVFDRTGPPSLNSNLISFSSKKILF